MEEDFMQLYLDKVCKLKKKERQATLIRNHFSFIEGDVKTLNTSGTYLGSLSYLLLYVFQKRKSA